MSTTRKRAIERARHLTRMGTIEIGDIVEVVENSYGGHEVGTKGKVVKQYFNHEGVLISRVQGDENAYWGSLNLRHPKSDLKLIKKGSN